MYRVMKMYRYTDEDKAIIEKARKENKNKRVEKRLQALELRAEGKSACPEDLLQNINFNIGTEEW